MKTILYLHGLGGSKETSVTYKALKDNLDCNVLSPEVPHDIIDAINWLDEFLKNNKIDLIVASSMGAFLALVNNSNILKIVINPAMTPYNDLMSNFGLNYKGEFNLFRSDGKYYILDEYYYNNLKKANDIYLDILKNNKQNKSIIGFFGKNDELFRHSNLYKLYYNDEFYLIDSFHHLEYDLVKKYILNKVKELI